MAKWWEKEPLRFECQPDCFKCCEKPGLVYFDRNDVKNVSRFLKCTPEEFKASHLTQDEGHWVLEVEGNAPCPFLTTKGCGIHEVKPKQCQTYPFWKENLNHKNTWHLVGGFCPGIDKGPMVMVESIKEMLKKFRL